LAGAGGRCTAGFIGHGGGCPAALPGAAGCTRALPVAGGCGACAFAVVGACGPRPVAFAARGASSGGGTGERTIGTGSGGRSAGTGRPGTTGSRRMTVSS
jgi:hypothetical protein